MVHLYQFSQDLFKENLLFLSSVLDSWNTSKPKTKILILPDMLF